MRHAGFEPTSTAWEAAILTAIQMAHVLLYIHKVFYLLKNLFLFWVHLSHEEKFLSKEMNKIINLLVFQAL